MSDLCAGPRVLFFGYSEVGYACLKLLLQRKVNVVAIFTHKDDAHETEWFRSVPKLAAAHGIPVHTPDSLKDPSWETCVRALRPDLLLSLYYRNMIPERIFAQAPLGAFNMHGSFLPRYRGRAPLNWAIIHGEDHTGVSLHVMEKSADTGDIIDQEKVPIGPRQTAGELTDPIRDAAVRVLARQLDLLLQGKATKTPQNHSQATYFGKRTPADGRINWALPSLSIFNLVRAVTHPFPGAFTCTPEGRQLTVWWGEIAHLPDAAASLPAGAVISTCPLTVRTLDGAFTITEAHWDGDAPTLTVATQLA